MTTRYCMDCKWLRLQVDFDEGSGYRCMKSGETLTGPLLDRRPCRDFAVGAFPQSGRYLHVPDS